MQDRLVKWDAFAMSRASHAKVVAGLEAGLEAALDGGDPSSRKGTRATAGTKNPSRRDAKGRFHVSLAKDSPRIRRGRAQAR